MDIKKLNDEGRELWNRKAKFWDELFGDTGNVFHRRLVEPSVLELLDLRPGETVLDVSCGNGALTRRLAALGARVTAIDFSDQMIELARRRTDSAGLSVEYLVRDVTDEGALLKLGQARFDAITCSMALMDIPIIEPLFRAAASLLRADGRFVFSTMHPAFNSNNPIFLHEKEDCDGAIIERFSIKIRQYLDMPPVKGAGAPGEPTPHFYYHRPLAELLGSAFAAGFALDGLLEPAFSAGDDNEPARLSWSSFPQIPPILSGRLRHA